MKNLKRIVASLLSVLMVLSCCTALFSLVAFAEEDGVLVSAGKSYTISGCGKGYAQYDTGLTDGVAKETINYDAADEWFGFYYNDNAEASVINAPGKVGYAIIDLGSVEKELYKFRAHYCGVNGDGIAVAKSISVSVSEDGETYTDAGSFKIENSGKAAYWTDLVLDSAVSARYVKFTVELGNGVFAFVNEFEVYAQPDCVVVNANYNFKYAAGDITTLTPWTMGSTLESILDKQYEWFNFAVLAWDANAGVYKVASVHEGTDVKYTDDPGKGVDFGTLAIPEYGFILGAHAQATANHDAVVSLKPGDTVYIYGENLTATAQGTEIEAVVTTIKDKSKASFAPVAIKANYNFNYVAASDIVTLTPWTMGSTLNSILKKQYEWFNFATLEWDIVEGVYKVTAVNIGTDSKADCDFGPLEIPQYGFILGAHDKATAEHNAVANLKVGDTVYVYGENLTATAQGTAINAVVMNVDTGNSFAPEIPALSATLVKGVNEVTVNPGITVTNTNFDEDLTLAIFDNAIVSVSINGNDYHPNRLGQIIADLPAGKNVVVFNNAGEEAANIVVTIKDLLRGDSVDHPAVIKALGSYTATVTDDHTEGVYYYEYISTIEGKLTITVNTASNWFYQIQNETAGKYGDQKVYADGVSASETIDVSIGDKVTFSVGVTDDSGWNMLNGTVDFTLSHDIWAGEKIRVDGKNTGAWQYYIGRKEYYDVNYAKDENNLYVEIDYYGSLNGIDASKGYGNGYGTNIRLWFHDADAVLGGQKAMSYTNFMDISYRDGAIVDCFLADNSNSKIYDYNDGVARSYTIENTLDENSWVMKLTMPLSEISVNGNVQFQPTVSNKDAELGNDALYYGRRVLWQEALGFSAWYWDSDSALPATMGSAKFGWDPVKEDVVVKNIAVGAKEYGTPIANKNYAGKLTDGVAPAADPTSSWRAFTLDAFEKIGYQNAIIDLGKVYTDIASVGAWYWSANQSDITKAKEIRFYASVDGAHWLNVGSPDLSDELHSSANWTPVWANVNFNEYLTARYIKMEVDPAKQFSFFGEIAVNVPTSLNILSSVGYAEDDLNIMVPFTDEEGKYYNTPKTISAALGVGTGRDYNYYSLIVVDNNNEVVATYKKLKDTTHGDVVIPEGGYLLGMHGTHGDLAAFQKIAVGDTIVLEGIYDVTELAGVRNTALEGISFYHTHTHNFVERVVLEGSVTIYEYKCTGCGGAAYYRDAKNNAAYALKVSHNNLYNWNTYETMIISEAGKTCLEATGGHQAEKKWIVYVVENINGKYVATKYYKDCDELTTLTAPEGGFLWYVNANNAAYNDALGGQLLNHIFVPASDDVIHPTTANGKYAYDTNNYPEQALYLYAVGIYDADYTAYGEAVANAGLLNANDYTAESWKALTDALAVDVSGKSELYQNEVDAATAAINAAIEGLVKNGGLLGDLDGNGVVDTVDLVELAQAVANGESGAVYDIDGNGIVDTIDLVELAQIIAG